MIKRRIVSADEQDVYTKWRRMYCWTQKAGAVKKVKRRTHKRERREGYLDVLQQLREEK